MISLRSLMVRRGQRMNRAFLEKIWNKLLLAIEERTIKRGGGVRLRHTPDGVIVTAAKRGSGGSVVVHPWQMTLDDAGQDRWRVRFRQGFINGVEGMIESGPDGRRISEVDPKTEETPALEISKDSFGQDRVSRVYAKVQFSATWFTEAVVMLAGPVVKAKEAYTFYKLIGFLVEDAAGSVEVVQNVFFNLSVTPIAQKVDRATYIVGVA